MQRSLKGAPEDVDLTEQVAEAVYQNASDFATHKLAHRIAEAPEDGIEITDAEAGRIKHAVANFHFYAQKPILEALGEKFE